MADLRIADAPELDESEVQGGLKIPTGGFGNKAINMNTVASWVVKDKDLPSKDYVDTAVAQGSQGLAGHVANKNNPHEVTKGQVGLGNVDNTADADKPVSNATSAALNLKADKTQLDGKADKSTTYTKTEVDEVVDDLYQSLEDNFVVNGAALPYDPQVTYNDGAVVNDNGTLKVVENGNLELAVKADGVQVGDSTLDVFAAELSPVPAKLARENVSVWDFFTKEELAAYKVAPSVFDAYRPIQAFFDYVRTNDVGTAHCSGFFYSTKGVVIGLNGASATKRYTGYFKISALSAIDTLIKYQIGTSTVWNGGIVAIGTGSNAYNTRTCRKGIEFASNADRTSIDFAFAQYFYEIGVQCADKATLSSVGLIRSYDNGSGFQSSNNVEYSLKSTYTHASNSGTSGAATQRSVINVDVLPPENIESSICVIINSEIYYVYNIDRTNLTLSIFPWIDNTQLSGDLIYVYGGGLDVHGGDASVLRYNQLDLMRNGIGYNCRALYAPNISTLCAQSNGVAVMIGNRPDGAIVGGVITELYEEINNFDICLLSRAVSNFDIQNTIALNENKIKLVVPRLSTNEPSPAFLGLNGVSIDGLKKSKNPKNNTSSIITLNLANQLQTETYKGNSLNFKLELPLNKNTLFGFDSKNLVVIGNNTANNNTPTQVVFTPDEGRTVNLQQSITFGNFNGVVLFGIILDVTNNNYIVQVLSGIDKAIKTSATYDPPSITAKSTEVTTVTLQGVSVGQPVVAAFSQYNAGVKINAVVSATNTVTVTFENTTDAAIDLASGTLTVKAI